MASTATQTEKRIRGWWRTLRIVGLSLAALLLLAWIAARGLIVRAELSSADAIVVLSGSSTYRERTEWAAQLFKNGRAPTIILTNDGLQGGWSAAEDRNPMFMELAANELRRKGVPGEKIETIMETASGTYQEATLVRKYSLAHNLHSILVVTSSYHSRRALWTFRRVFQESDVLIGMEPVAPGEQAPGPVIWWAHRLGWKLVPGEYLKMIYYWLHYR